MNLDVMYIFIYVTPIFLCLKLIYLYYRTIYIIFFKNKQMQTIKPNENKNILF